MCRISSIVLSCVIFKLHLAVDNWKELGLVLDCKNVSFIVVMETGIFMM